MLIKGKYNEAEIFTNNVDETTLSQVYGVLNNSFSQDSKIRIMSDCHAGAGCVIGTTMTITDKVVPNLVGVDIGCLDKDTEFLTPFGWKTMDSFEEDDFILQYNKNTDMANFEKPIKYIVKSCDSFYHFKNSKGLDQMLSKEHKILVWKGYKSKGYSLEDMSPEKLLSKSLEKGYYGFKAAFNLDEEKLFLTNEEIRLDIMIAADGTIRKELDFKNRVELHFKNRVELHFIKNRKILRAEKLLKECQIDFQKYLNADETVTFSFYVPSYINKNLSKYWQASKDQLKIVSEECLLWDGVNGYRSYFSSTNKENADVVQFAFAANDIRAGISKSVNSQHSEWADIYVVTPTKNNIVGFANALSTVATLENSLDNKKYCFTTRTGYFVARRNGKIFITGNCGIKVVKFKQEIDLKEFDKTVKKLIPSGFDVRKRPYRKPTRDIEDIRATGVDFSRAELSLGTLGGGNHFVEIDKDELGNSYLLIHSGSRQFGLQIAKYYQELAVTNTKKFNVEERIEKMKAEGNVKDINKMIAQEKAKRQADFNKDLAYLTGADKEDYLHDMRIATAYAKNNRDFMAEQLVKAFDIEVLSEFTTVHNYIGDDNILRKGAVSAKWAEVLIIPMNMRDGSLICTGKGNENWNYSAPHGAGRVLSRSKAKKVLKLKDFQETMDNVYSSSVCVDTLDEAPMAYKPMDEIMENIYDTVNIAMVIKPIYNYKAH